MKHSPFRFAAIAALALLVSSCVSDKKLQYCPGWTSVLDAVVVTQFKPGAAPDPNPRLVDWKGAIDLGTLFATGVFE